MSSTSTPPSLTAKFQKWHRAVLSICLIIFSAELAFCLIVLPWRSTWEISYIPMHVKQLSGVWMSFYFRGILTGLGLLNVYVALAEVRNLVMNWFGKVNR
jgi:hypothetical protein